MSPDAAKAHAFEGTLAFSEKVSIVKARLNNILKDLKNTPIQQPQPK